MTLKTSIVVATGLIAFVSSIAFAVWLDPSLVAFLSALLDLLLLIGALIAFAASLAVDAWRRRALRPRAALGRTAPIWTWLLGSALGLAALGFVLNRDRLRWQVLAHELKPGILAKPGPDLRHDELDELGWLTPDITFVYAVFDPQDALAAAKRDGNWLIAPGLPCPVGSITPLEKHWYAVRFLRNRQWDSCK